MNKDALYKMYLVLGDWSGDGHKQYEKILLQSNWSVAIVQQAYKDSCNLTGISFNGGTQYHDEVRDWTVQQDYQICTEYEMPELTEKCKEILKGRGIDTSQYEKYTDVDSFVKLWCDFVKISLPSLIIEKVSDKDEIPFINGFHSDISDGFGYGLYY